LSNVENSEQSIFLKHNPKIKILKLSTKYQVILDKIASTKTFLQLQLFSQIQTGYHFFFMQSNLHYIGAVTVHQMTILQSKTSPTRVVTMFLSQRFQYQVEQLRILLKRIQA
jgi:hypothetical protein